MRSLLNADTPTATPTQCSEPYGTMFAVRVAIPIQCEPGIGLYACAASPALQHVQPGMYGFLVELPLTGPTAGQVAQPITFSLWKIPGRRLRTLEYDRRTRAVLDGGIAPYDACLRKHGVMQM